MRKIFTTIIVCVTVGMLPACRTVQEELHFQGMELRASMEEGTLTKTQLSEAGNGVSHVLWSENDLISVFADGSRKAQTFKLSTGAGTQNATFLGETDGSSFVAFYPSSMVPSMSGETIRLTIPAEQNYVPESFAPGAFPMAAKSNSRTLVFRNTASILRLSLKGHNPVTRIVFRSMDKQAKVTGKATVSVLDPSNPVLNVESDGCDSLVLKVGEVNLDEDTPTNFFLVLPAQTYKGGFFVRIYSNKRYMDKVYEKDFTMQRAQLHKADPFSFEPNGLDESTYLEGSGTDSDPFLVQSISDLVLLRDAVNAGISIKTISGGEVDASFASYLLTSDLDMRPVCSESGRKSWVPIGTEENPFNGVFKGQGLQIDNLYIKVNKSYSGLFGYVNSGTISDLRVNGKIESNGDFHDIALVVGHLNGTINNCYSFGEVSVSQGSYLGGVVGQGGKIDDCVNYASVTGNGCVGGVVGLTYRPIRRCLNHGKIMGTGSSVGGIVGVSNAVWSCSNDGDINGNGNVGGISGNNNADIVTSCSNSGSVFGKYSVGGITGYSRQGAYVWNNVNRGAVSGENNVGGITGHLSSDSSRGNTTLKNCVNLGIVSSSTASESVGAICGFNEGENTAYNYKGCIVEQVYWIDDKNLGLGTETGIGRDESISSALFPLTQAQMKGSDTGLVLYGPSYSKLKDALNAFAYDNLTAFNSLYYLQGWDYSVSDGYTQLTGLKVQKPGNEQVVFTLSETSFDLNALALSFEVTVTSSLDYSLEKPSWITIAKEVQYETDRFKKTYFFETDANSEPSARNGVIKFTNSVGTTLQVFVKQKGSFLLVNAESLTFSGSESSRRFSITSSIEWKVESDVKWLTLVPDSGTGDGVVSVRAEANNSDTARAANLKVSSLDGNIVHIISVAQSAAEEEGNEQDWTTHDFVHKSIAMRYTATWCGWCPRMNKTMKRALEQAPDAFNYIVLHDGGSDLQFSHAGTLASQFGFNAFPTGMVDGRIMVSNGEIESTAKLILDAVKETVDTYGTVTGVDIRSSVNGRTVNVDVGVYAKESGNYKLTVLLLEDGIINPQTDYEEGDHPRYVHDNVIRVAMSNVLGDSFTFSSPMSKQVFNYSATVSGGFQITNMRVVVYVQRTFGSYPKIQSGNYGDYFIDNSATVEVGGTLKLALDGGSGSGGTQEGDENEGIVPGDDINIQ